MFSKNEFNLLPKSFEKQRNAKLFMVYTVVFLVIVNVCFVGYISILLGQIGDLNSRNAIQLKKVDAAKPLLELEASINEYKTGIDKILAYQKSITSVEAPVFEIFKDLEALVPSDITLNSVQLAEDGKITIVGMSKDEFVVCDLIESLKSMDKLSDIYLKSVTKKEDEKNQTGNYANIYNIECQVKGIAKKDDKATATKAETTPSSNGGKK